MLEKIRNVEGERLDRLIDLHGVLPGCCRSDPVMVFLQPAEQTPPRLGVGPTPVRAHALVPPIPQGLLPVIGKALRHRIKMRVLKHLDILPQLLQSALRWGYAVRMVKDMHELPDNTAEAVDKAFSRAFPVWSKNSCGFVHIVF